MEESGHRDDKFLEVRGMNVMRSSVGNKLNYLFTFLLIYSFGTPVANVYYKQITVIVAAIFVVAYIFRRRYEVDKRAFLIFILLFFLLIANIVVNLETDYAHYVGRLAVLITVLLYVTMVDHSDFSETYINIIYWISILAIILYVFFNVFPNIAWQLPSITVPGGGEDGKTSFAHVAYLYFISLSGNANTMQYEWSKPNVERNAGMFREPGIFQIYLNIALIQLCFKNDKSRKDYKKIFVIVIAIISTISTSGIFSMIMILLATIISDDERIQLAKNVLSSQIGKLILVIGGCGGIAVLVQLMPKLLDKLGNNSPQSMSSALRIMNSIKDLNVWMNKPIFGVGISTYELSGGTENGVTCTLACYGLVFVVVLLGVLLLYLVNLSTNSLSNLLIIIAVIPMIITQNTLFMPCLIVLYFYGYIMKTRL